MVLSILPESFRNIGCDRKTVVNEMTKTLNWGLGAAIGAILLAAVLTLYWVYDRLIGIDNLKMGS